MMLDSQLYDETCLAFWRVLWSVFASLAVAFCSLLPEQQLRNEWMLLPGYHSQLPEAQQEGLNASVPDHAPFFDPKIPLARICHDLEVKLEHSSTFL